MRCATAIPLAGLVVAAVNRATVSSLPTTGRPVTEPVTVCIPARNEATRLPQLLADLRNQRRLTDFRVLVLDDASTDATYAAAQCATVGDPRFRLHRSVAPPPPGWTGKAAACRRLAEQAGDRDGVLVFLDADVRVSPAAVAGAVHELRRRRIELLTPWPRQLVGSPAERLVQPLLCWSWFASLPLAWGNRSARASTAVACGQFLVCDSVAYARAGGHRAVASSLTEDLELARAVRRTGGVTAVVPAGRHASCRMYDGATELGDGYARWLWSAYGGLLGSVAVAAGLGIGYLVPPLAAVFGRGTTQRAGLIGYGAAVASRILARTAEGGGYDVAAALAHPASIGYYLWLSRRSHRAHRRGELIWKGRAVGR